MNEHKEYLGDAVYAAWDGNGIVLTTEDGGIRPTNTIVLEPKVYAALLDYVKRLEAGDEDY